MMTTAVKSGLVLLVCVQFVTALNPAELDQFRQGNGYNRTVKITSNNDGTVTFSVYKACGERGHERPDPPPTTPSIADAPTDGTPILPGVPDPTSDLPEKLVEQNCTDHEFSLTVKSSAVAIQAPDQPAPLPKQSVIGFALDGRPIIQGKAKCGGRKKGGKRGDKGGRRRGGGRRGSSREGRRERRDVRGTRSSEREERRAMLEAEDQVLGVAVDGYPIYSANSSEVGDRLLRSSDVDQCGGRCDSSGNYRYHAVEVGDGSEREARVVLRLGCIKGEMLETALTGFEPRRDRHHDDDDDDDDVEGSGEGDDNNDNDDDDEEEEEKKYLIWCDADVSLGSCVSSAMVSNDSYECVEPHRSGSGDDQVEDDEAESSEESRSVAKDRRSEIRERISQAAEAAKNRRTENRRKVQQAAERGDDDDHDGDDDDDDDDEDEDDEDDSEDESSQQTDEGRRFRGRLSGRGRNTRRRN